MLIDFHRHCQATILSANGTDEQNGLSWKYIHRLKYSLDNLPKNWIQEFELNRDNITQDFASVLKILNSTVDNYLPLSGGTMGGFLTLHSNPTLDMHAATKRYVDYVVEQNSGSGSGDGTITGITMNGVLKGTEGEVDLGNVVSSIKVNGDVKTPNSNGLVDIGTFSSPSFSVTNTDNNGTIISRINYDGKSYDIKMPQGSGSGGSILDSDIVHKTGDEIIDGNKTFNGITTLNGTSTKLSESPLDTASGHEVVDAAWVKNIYLEVFNQIYPVGSIYLDANNLDTCPMQSVIIGSSWQKLGNKLLTGGSKAPVIGNGTAIGLTNGTEDGVMNISSGDKHSIGLAVTNSKVNIGQSTANYSNPSINYRAGGLTTNPEKSGMVADIGSANGVMVNIWKRIA